MQTIHRRRMELEDKAKVIASVWGGRICSIPFRSSVLPWSIRKKMLNSSYFSKLTEAKQLAQQGIEQLLPPKQTRRPLPCLIILSSYETVLVLNCPRMNHLVTNYPALSSVSNNFRWHTVTQVAQRMYLPPSLSLGIC